MQLLIVSDTHGRPGPLLDAAEREEGAAACFFLGDGLRDVPLLQAAQPGLPVYAVRGNCDFSALEPEEGLAPFGGALFYYTHGHLLGVKQGLDRLWHAAARAGADAALYGHTHTPHYEYRDGIHLFCPGSVSQPRGGGATYGVVSVAGGVPVFEVKALAGR